MPNSQNPENPTRRGIVGTGLGIGAAGILAQAAPPGAAPAQAQAQGARPAAPTPAPAADIITRRIPRSGEVLPAIGLGTFLTFDLLPGQPRDHFREVMRIYWEGGARVIDTSPLYGMAEVNAGTLAAGLGITDQAFMTNKLWGTGDFLADAGHAQRSLEASLARLWRERIDVMQCHNLVNIDVAVPMLQAWKREGLTRYAGISHHDYVYFPAMAEWVGRGNLDFVQVRYSILSRQAEETVLRAAADTGTAVLVNMPLEKARLHRIVEGRPLPEFAREFGATTWAQFFLKWVIAHPAVTCTLPATSNPAHAAENIAALRGPLPDAAMRARMVRHMETIPGFAELERMPWYPGKRYPGVIARAQAALRSRLAPA